MPLAEQRLSPQEYLDLERTAQHKSEYFNGRMHAMAGNNQRHDLIVSNVTGELHGRFKGRPCRVYTADMRVKVSDTGLYTYPDVSALCGEPRYDDPRGDTLLNPMLIVEVLSASTESYDRGEKFAHYRRVASVTDYVLIAPDRIRVEHYARQPDNRWLMTEYLHLEDSVALGSLDASLALADIYDKIDLRPEENQLPGHP